MFLHLGNKKSLFEQEIIGIFDYNLIKKSKVTKEFIEIVNCEGNLNGVGSVGEYKSFIVTKDKVFLSTISSVTLQKRVVNFTYLNDEENERIIDNT